MTTRSSRRFSIAANTPKVDVDNRFPLKKYYRTADNLLKQAYIYREEKNILELYILLLRFSSLVGETIPEHQDYYTSSAKQRAVYKQKCNQVLSELEFLKPEVQKRVEELNSSIVDVGGQVNKYEWPPISKRPVVQSVNNENTNWQLQALQNVQIRQYQVDEQLRDLSWKLPPPKQETLSRHSFLGPNGLHAPWDMPISQARVQYPSYIDAAQIEVPSLNQSENKTISVIEAPLSAASVDFEVETPSQSVSGGEHLDIISQLSTLMQPSPPPVPVPVQSTPIMSDSLELSKQENSPAAICDPFQGPLSALADDVKQTGDPKSLHISTKMMEEFLKLARSNTNNNIETCAVLAGSFKNATFYVTALVVPKQQATSDTCQTVNEEEIFDWQDKRGLFQLGWIHTHPTQSCFMSSVDLHTHYSYQVMLPEAIAIVMAPRDDRRKYGIFRLSDPTGVKAIQKCPLRGFHAHDQPSDGNPIYEQCSHVFLSSTLKYQVADLR